VPEDRKESRKVRDLLEEGNRLAREGDFGAACAVYEGALRLFPDYSQARFNLAVALTRDGKRKEAREQLLRFLEMDPFNPMTERARDMLADLGNGGAE
jgi:Flp pilus assembly protein TadD